MRWVKTGDEILAKAIRKLRVIGESTGTLARCHDVRVESCRSRWAQARPSILEGDFVKLRLPVALVCAGVALISLIAASPLPNNSASPLPGNSSSPTNIPSASTTARPLVVDFSFQVQRGSVLRLVEEDVCPVLPPGQIPSRIDVTAVISVWADTDGKPTASAVARADAKWNWHLDLLVPTDATLGKGTLKVTCSAVTSHGPYIASQSHPIWIIKETPSTAIAATPIPDQPNWPPLLLLILIAGMVLGRELSRYRIWPFAAASSDAASKDE